MTIDIGMNTMIAIAMICVYLTIRAIAQAASASDKARFQGTNVQDTTQTRMKEVFEHRFAVPMRDPRKKRNDG